MKRFLLLSLCLGLFTVPAAFAETKLDAKVWKNLKTYDVRTLSKNFDSSGGLVAVKFAFRGKDIHHMKPNWYEGSIWQTNPEGKKGFSDVRINVSKKDLPAFQAITTDSTSAAELTVYGRITRDPERNYTFILLYGTKAATDSAGNATVSW